MEKPKNTLDAIDDDCYSSLILFSRKLCVLSVTITMSVILALMIISDRQLSDLNERLGSDIQVIEERMNSLEKKLMTHEEACNKQKQDLMELLDSLKKGGDN